MKRLGARSDTDPPYLEVIAKGTDSVSEAYTSVLFKPGFVRVDAERLHAKSETTYIPFLVLRRDRAHVSQRELRVEVTKEVVGLERLVKEGIFSRAALAVGMSLDAACLANIRNARAAAANAAVFVIGGVNQRPSVFPSVANDPGAVARSSSKRV